MCNEKSSRKPYGSGKIQNGSGKILVNAYMETGMAVTITSGYAFGVICFIAVVLFGVLAGLSFNQAQKRLSFNQAQKRTYYNDNCSRSHEVTYIGFIIMGFLFASLAVGGNVGLFSVGHKIFAGLIF